MRRNINTDTENTDRKVNVPERRQISVMDELFEASFSRIESVEASKLRTKCGKCRRYMKFIPLKYGLPFFEGKGCGVSRSHCRWIQAGSFVLSHLRGDIFTAAERRN